MVNGQVNAVAHLGDRTYLGGSFTSIGSRLYVGGAFTSIAGQIHNRLAALDIESCEDRAERLGDTNGDDEGKGSLDADLYVSHSDEMPRESRDPVPSGKML